VSKSVRKGGVEESRSEERGKEVEASWSKVRKE
jgi:hypothetical protein